MKNSLEDAKKRLPSLEMLPKPLLIAEDFAYYQRTLPGLFILLGTGTGFRSIPTVSISMKKCLKKALKSISTSLI